MLIISNLVSFSSNKACGVPGVGAGLGQKSFVVLELEILFPLKLGTGFGELAVYLKPNITDFSHLFRTIKLGFNQLFENKSEKILLITIMFEIRRRIFLFT